MSLTAGTIFQDTRKPLSLWFRAMWWVVVQKNGVSAVGLQQLLGLKRYETAWTWLHKIRRAMIRPDRDRLRGRVEVDETFVGGEHPGKRGRGATGKTLVAIAAEESGRGIGRIRMQCVSDASKRSLLAFIEACVEPGSTIHTDGWTGYNGLAAKGYIHVVSVIGENRKKASELFPRVHRVASLVHRWLLGTHQGGVGPSQLAYYLDEFTFRFNRRRARHRGLLFYKLVQQAVNMEPVPYDTIVGGRSRNRENPTLSSPENDC